MKIHIFFLFGSMFLSLIIAFSTPSEDLCSNDKSVLHDFKGESICESHTPFIEAILEKIMPSDKTAESIENPYDENISTQMLALNSPYGICTDSTNRTIVAESGNNRISVFDVNGGVLFTFGQLGTGLGQLSAPRDVAVDANDNIYVADSGNDRVHIFDSAGNPIEYFGSLGTGPGYLDDPKGIYVDKTTGKIYVADTNNQRVQRFNDDFAIDTTWSGDGIVGATGIVKRDHTGFDRPTDVSVNPVNGRVYVADYGNHRLEVFTSEGVYHRTYLAVYRPNSLAFDTSGNLYIAGEDPNNSYTYYDGRLRFLKAGEELIRSHYTGGIDNISRIEGGVSLRGDGAILFTDVSNNRIAKTDSNFTKPITDLVIIAQGDIVTFRYKTSQPCTSSVRYGPTSSY